MDNEDLTNPKDEKIFELQQEINRLRGQVTYLQEELSSIEDDAAKLADRYKDRIADLEEQLGDALYGNQ